MLFKGELVNLRAIREQDFELAVEYMSDPEIAYNADFDAPLPTSVENLKEWLEGVRKRSNRYKGFNLAIETKDGKFLGTCGVHHMDRKNKVAQVGIGIGNKEYLGKGYGTEAMKLLLEFLFEEYNVNKVKLGVFAFNERAIKSYQKCGFKTEAIVREVLYRFGNYHDMINMAILREDYYKDRGV